MKSKNRMKKYSLIVSLVLALSLALSPVSAFAEELDTPVHEDPIDEVQSNTTWIHRNLSVPRGTAQVTFSAHAYCDYSWTEGIGAQFNDATTISITNVRYDGNIATFLSADPTGTGSQGIWAKAERTFEYVYNGSYFFITITVLCDEYGDLTMYAS